MGTCVNLSMVINALYVVTLVITLALIVIVIIDKNGKE